MYAMQKKQNKLITLNYGYTHYRRSHYCRSHTVSGRTCSSSRALASAGISALVCILYANYYAFANLGMAGGFITLGISAIACIGSLIWFMRSKMLDKLALKKDIDSKVDRSAEDSVKVGDTGISTTRLAQIGYAEINGKIVEVKSIDGFLNEKDSDYCKPYHRRYNHG